VDVIIGIVIANFVDFYHDKNEVKFVDQFAQ